MYQIKPTKLHIVQLTIVYKTYNQKVETEKVIIWQPMLQYNSSKWQLNNK